MRKGSSPSPWRAENLSLPSGEELSLVHLPTPHALTALHSSSRLPGQKAWEGLHEKPGAQRHFQEESRKDKGEFELFLTLPIREDLVMGVLNGHIPSGSGRDLVAGTSDICEKIKCRTPVYQAFPT